MAHFGLAWSVGYSEAPPSWSSTEPAAAESRRSWSCLEEAAKRARKSGAELECELCHDRVTSGAAWASHDVNDDVPGSVGVPIESKCLACHGLHQSTKPWMRWDEFAELCQSDENRNERDHAVQILNGTESCPWHQNEVDHATTWGIKVFRSGTFLDRNEFKTRWKVLPEDVGVTQCEVPGDFGGKPVRGVLLMGVSWPEYRQVHLQTSSSTVRVEHIMPPKFHVLVSQDVETFDNQVKSQKEEKASAWRCSMGIRAATVAGIEEKVVAFTKNADSDDEFMSVATAASVKTANVPKPASALGSSAQKVKQRSTEDVDQLSTPPKFGGSIASDEKEETVDTWMRKLPLDSILGGWKPGRLTGHADSRANALLAEETSKSEGRRLKNYLELVEVARTLRPETLLHLETAELDEKLRKLSKVDVNLPTALKEGLLQKNIAVDIAAFLSKPPCEKAVEQMFTKIAPFCEEEKKAFDMMAPLLHALDGSAGDLGLCFLRLVGQDTARQVSRTAF